jgi:hypothetical protein
VPVTLGVPVEALAPRAEGQGFLAEVPLGVAVEDKKGGRAELPSLHLKVLLTKLPQAGTYARFQTALELRDVEQRLVFTVQDPASGQTLWGQADFVPGRGK